MTRLTRRDPDGAANFADAEFESVCAELTPTNREKVRAIVDALAEWEDAKEQGRLVELPCNVGDTVYQTDGVRVYDCAVKNLIFDAGDFAFDESAIGERVFLTRAEAETALKGGA